MTARDPSLMYKILSSRMTSNIRYFQKLQTQVKMYDAKISNKNEDGAGKDNDKLKFLGK